MDLITIPPIYPNDPEIEVKVWADDEEDGRWTWEYEAIQDDEEILPGKIFTDGDPGIKEVGRLIAKKLGDIGKDLWMHAIGYKDGESDYRIDYSPNQRRFLIESYDRFYYVSQDGVRRAERARITCPVCTGTFTLTSARRSRWRCATEYIGRFRQMCAGVGKPPRAADDGAV